MNQHNSSISSSSVCPRWRYRPLISIAAWTIGSLAAIDIFINVVFAYPMDPKVTNPSRWQLYFEYGRSAEGALARMTRNSRSETAPITLTGWYEPLDSTIWPTDVSQKQEGPQEARPIVTIYGASHSVKLATALARVSKRLTARSVGAPGATANWSYGAYLRDRGGRNSKAVVLSFNSTNLATITSFSPAVWSPDFPMPYTADRFYLEGDKLKVMHAPYDSFDQYTTTFFARPAWSAAVDFFARNDPFYDPLLFRHNFLDHSSLFRLIRRAYATNERRAESQKVLDKSGYHPESEAIEVAKGIIHDFAKQARADGMIPIIYLVNNRGYSDYLFRALKPALDADHVPFLSSHTIVSPDDSRGYLPDSHFTDENDDRLATALAEIIEK